MKTGKLRRMLPAGLALLILLPIPPIHAAGGIEDFVRFASYDYMSLSPGGTHLAVTHRQDSNEMLSVFRLPALELVSSTRFSRSLGVDEVIWATEERLLIQPARRHPTRDDYKVPTGEIAAMDVDGSNLDMLFGFRAGFGQLGVKARKRESRSEWARVIDVLPEDPEHVIIRTGGYNREGIRNEALLLDVRNGETRRLARSPIRNGYFVTDNAHSVNLVGGQNDQGDFEIYARQADGPFELLQRYPLNSGSIVPLAPSTRPGYYLFADSATNPMLGLVEWNPASGERTEIFRHAAVDYARLYMAPYPTVWAVKYIDHYPYYHYPDESHPLVDLHKSLRAMYPADDVSIIGQSDDFRLALAYSTGPKNPGTFFLIDAEKRAMVNELETRPWLRDTVLGNVAPIEITTRDGLSVRSYLTTPGGKEKNLPLVVLVHGGPHGIYDTWGFDPEAQLLASRGYAVLQVNFRGSGGRGQAFLEAGFGKWGEEMQDDITDTVRWVVSEGIADPERICIYGASYGGYSALVGAYRDPELYRCAIGYAGVYDLPMMYDKGDIPEAESGVNFLESVLGTDRAELESRSPTFNAAKIRAKVMLVHGKLDERAPFAHARKMRQALIDAGNPPQWLVENREGHGFRDHDNRLAMYTALVAFLDGHLK